MVSGTVVKVLKEEKNCVTVEIKWDRECLREGDGETPWDKLMRSTWNSNEHEQGTWRENASYGQNGRRSIKNNVISLLSH
jgi:hypothetical protein